MKEAGQYINQLYFEQYADLLHYKCTHNLLSYLKNSNFAFLLLCI